MLEAIAPLVERRRCIEAEEDTEEERERLAAVVDDRRHPRRRFEREVRLGVDLGHRTVERVVRDDVAPRGDAEHVDAGRFTVEQPVGVALREHVVGDLDHRREDAAQPILVERGVEVMQDRDDVQRRVVVDVQVVGRLEAAHSTDVFDDLTAGLEEAIEQLDRVARELRHEVVVAVHEPRGIARDQDVRGR